MGRTIRARRRSALYQRQPRRSASKPANTPMSQASDAEQNLLTVEREQRRADQLRPAPLAGRGRLPRSRARVFSQGDRVQFTAPDKDEHIANRELGTIEHIDDDGNLESARLRARGGSQPPKTSASRLRLRGHQPQQPGHDRRPRAGPRGHREATRNSSTAAWLMSPSPVAATMRKSIPMMQTILARLSREVSHAAALEWNSEDRSNTVAGHERGDLANEVGTANEVGHGYGLGVE